MRIDLHTHSNRSDGTDTPSELVTKAVAAGLDVVALTDHDSTAGWEEATRTAEDTDLVCVPGIEISTHVDQTSVHLLGYDFDPRHPPLVDELQRVLEGRNDRLPRAIAQLQTHGIAIEESDVHRQSTSAAATGRPHIADALVELGVVANRDEAFRDYLTPGKPGYAGRYSAELRHAIGLINDAGGRAVIAHPWSRGSRRVLPGSVIAELAALGLAGIEVDHNDHDDDVRAELRGIADDLDLIVTGSSDYHGTGKVGFDLGCNLTAPDQFERLLPSV